MTNKYLNSIFALAVACGISSAQAGDWTWHGADGAYTSGGDSSWWGYSATTPADYLVFQGDAFNKTIVFDNSLAPTKGVYVGRHSGGSYPSDQVTSIVWQASSPEYGISSASEGLIVAGYGGSPICQLRIEGGSYTFGTKSSTPAAWDGVAVMIGCNNDGSLELASGTITCLNNLWLHSRTENKHGSLIIGDGIGANAATVTVDRAAVTKLADNNGYYGSLVLRKGGVLETSFIVWNSSSGTLTLDGGTIAKIGNMKTDTRYTDVNAQADLLCGDVSAPWSYDGSKRTIQMTANGGTIQCDSPALLQSPIALAEGVTSAVLNKTGDEMLKLDPTVIPSGMGLNIQEGAVRIDHWASRPSSLEIGTNGRFEVSCNPGTITVVGPGVPFTYPNGANLKDIIVPVGSGFVDYSVTYTTESGLVITTSDTPLDPVDPPSSSLISTVDGFTIKRRGLGENVSAKDWFERLGKFPDETLITTLVDATNALAHGYIIFDYTAEVFGGALNADVVAAYNAEFTGQFNYDRNGGTGGGYPGGRYNRPDAAYVTVNGQITVPSAGKWTFCVGARANSYVSLSINGTDVEVYETWQSQESSELKFVTVDFPTANTTYDVEILQYMNAKSGNQNVADLWLEFSAAKGEYTAFDSTVFELVGDSVTEYTVTFNSNGGSEVAAQTVRENRTATRPTDPTKSGYTFAGWTLDDADYDFTAPVVADITLVAKWTQNEEPDEPDEPTHEHVWSETWTTNRVATATTSGERQRACTVEGCTEVQKQLLIATGAPGASVDPATVNRATGDVTSSYTDRSAGALMSQNKTYTDGSFTLPYRLHVPQAATSEGTVKYPLVLFLHGAGERGSDNGNQLNNCVGTICSYALAHGDAYIVAPQCPAGDDTTATWAGVNWGGTSMTRNADPTPQMQAVMDLIYDLVKKNPSIDPTRIYVTGISMGGFGTWDIVSRMPDNTFAAMMPVCGGADATQAALYEGETIRFFHGGSDPTVSPVYSQSMDAALTTAGIAHDYIEYEGVDHVGCWADDKAYATANLDWLFGKVRTTVPAEASEEPEEPDEDETVWTSAPLSATAAEIATTGTLVYAYTRQASTDPATLTVNTVPFTCVTANANESYTSSDFDLDFTSENGSYDFNEKGDSSTDFLKLLGGGWYQRTQNDSFERELTLKNLTVGKKYLVQLVSHWTNHKSRLYAPGSDSIYVDGATDGEKSEGITDSRDWTYGGVLNGIFTATDTAMIFTLRGVAPYFVAVNAIQVRELDGSSGDDDDDEPVWTATQMNEDGTTIRTDGTLVYALARQDPATPTTLTVNTVPFTCVTATAGSAYDSDEIHLDFTSPNGNYDFNEGGDSSTDYRKLLGRGWFQGTTDGTFYKELILKQLTPGHKYLVQLVSHWTRHKARLYAPGSDTVYVDTDGVGDEDNIIPDSSDWPYGGVLTGIFTATDTTQSFMLHGMSNHFVPINAIQVRDITDAEDVVAPAIGTVSASVNGQNVTVSLSSVVIGTDTEGVAATAYDVFAQTGSDAAAKVAEGETGTSASFTLENLADGSYTYSVYITNNFGVASASKSVSFQVGADEPDPGETAVDWIWIGPDGGSTTTAANWNNYTTPIGHMVFNGNTSGTIVFADSYELNNGLWVGCHGGSWPSTQTNSFVWRAASDSCGIASAPEGMIVSGYGGTPVCLLRIEGGSYTVGNPDNITWESSGLQVGCDNYGELELVSGEIDVLNKFYVHGRTGNNTGFVVIGDGVGDDTATISVIPTAFTVLGQGLNNRNYGALIIRKGGVLETSFIDWATDDSTLTLDGGTIVKNGDLSQIALLSGYPENKQFTLFASHYGYSGTDREIYLTENGGTFKCDSPALIEPAILLAEGTTSAVLTKTGDETLTLRCANVNPANSQQPEFGVSVQEGDLNVLAGTKFPSVALGEDGRIVIDCDGYAGTYYTIVEPGGSVTFPEGADLTKLIVPVGQGSSKYAASYSPETGLVLGPNYALAEAEINGVRYPTLELAAENVKKGETITVLRDIVYEEARTITIPVEATLDLGGHSITFYDWYELNGANEWRTTDSIVFQQGGVIKNGSLLEPADTVNITDYTYAGNARVVVGDGENTVTLTVENLTVGDAAGHEPFCVFRANKGAKVSISGGTYHAATLFASLDGSSLCYVYGGNFYLRGYHYCRPDGDTSYRNGEFYVYGGAFSLPPAAYYVKDGNVVMHDVTNTELPYSVVPASEAPHTEPGWSYHYTDQAAAEAAVVAKRNVGGEDVFYTSIADAVMAAQAYLRDNWATGGGEDTITLVADVTAFDRSAVADLWTGNNLLIDGAGHTVKVRTPYVAETGYVASDFTLEFPYLFNTHSGNTTMRDIHIMAGGIVDSYKSSGECYAILNNNDSRLKLENVTITRSNGAIMNRDAYLYAEDCRFVRNCRYCAGGIYNYGVAVLERSSLSENRSLASGGGGGAIENPGMLYVNNCVFCNNSSTEIGGAINNYSSWKNVGLYMMNTTMAGNFSAVSSFTSHCKDPDYQYYGGGIGLRAHQSETFLGVNNLIIDNYQVKTDWSGDTIWTSDINALCETIKDNQDIYPIGMTNRLFYSVYQTFTHEANTVLNGCVLELENNRVTDDQTAKNVFNAYYASKRTYQNAVVTKVDINGAQLVSKDDGSLNADLARYAPIKRTLNADKTTYTYGDAVLGTQGVYTYFDASDWTNGIVRMGYAPVVGEVAYGDDDELEHAGTIVPLGDVPLASAEYMVTNYYERIGGRSFGVTGASGWLDEDITYYTVRLARDPENGTASGITLYGDTYADGTTITLTATPGFAREFLGWYIVDPATGTETLIEGSNKTIWELTVDQDYVLVPKFSDILEYLTPEPSVHAKMADDDPTDGPSLYPITVTTKWMTDHYSDIIPDEDTSFIDYLAHMVETSTVEVAKAWLTEILEETDSVTGLKMWQDYVLGIEPGDPNGKIWINSPQYMSTGKNLVRMEMNKLTPVKGTKFTINYRLDKKLGAATEFSRADVNTTGSYDVNVTTDPSGLYVIDLLFIPEGKATSEEYVTTVNTAGVLCVSNTAKRAAIAVPWTKLQPTGSSDVSALDLVKTTNLTPGDILYVYDDKSETKNYRAWKMADNGNWAPLNVFQLDEDGLVDWTNTLAAAEGSTVTRGLGVWLERANTNDFIYVCGQYEAAPVTSTALSEGWNLLGNPSGAAFDLSTLTPAEGDQIVVPTAAEPKTYTYEKGVWGYWKTTTVEYGGKQYIKSTRVTNDTIVPAGVGFWYISEGKEAINW